MLSAECARETPPATWHGALRHIGPGLIVTASIVGSGELIVTPRLGAMVGFTLLWFIIFGCVVKVFVQIELARHAIVTGRTTLEALDAVPGPRVRVSWLLWLWLAMFVGTVFQVGGIIGGLAHTLALGGVGVSHGVVAVLVAVSCSLLLALGRYRPVERVSTVMVFLFTLCTLFAVIALQWTPYRISSAHLVEGLSFQLPPGFTTAFAAFGLIGVGASELIYYPYWCLEKGYARSRGWVRVMTTDAWASLVIYTGATVAFYLLGAAVLHAKALEVSDVDPVGVLSQMYRETYGAPGLLIFLVGAFVVLYSTVFVASASTARVLVDAVALFGIQRYPTPEARGRTVRLASMALPCASALVYLAFGSPVSLVLVGALAQGLMLPFLAFAALYFYRHGAPVAPRRTIWTIGLWLSSLAIAMVGLYQIWEQLAGR